MRLSVDLILYVIFCGQGRALSLRYDIEFNLIATVSYHISANFHGGSKPPPYAEQGSLCRTVASHFLRYTIHAKQKGFLIKGSLCNFQNNAIKIKSDYINYNTYLIPRRTWDIS